MSARSHLLAIALLCLTITSGCGSRLTDVSGVATTSGKPLADLFLKFEPIDGGSPAWGVTDATGGFDLQCGEGAGVVPGTYRVWVSYRMPDADPSAPGEQLVPADMLALENKYGREVSELTVEIKPSQEQLALEFER